MCRLTLLALITIALAACGLGEPTRESLSQEEEALLQFDGSVELIADGGHDAESTPEGPLAALAWREYGVDATWDEIVEHFDAELRADGWLEGGGTSGFASTREHAVEAWHKGDRILRLAHRRDPGVDPPRSFLTFYRVNLLGKGVPSD
jgi:hypothetical protein